MSGGARADLHASIDAFAATARADGFAAGIAIAEQIVTWLGGTGDVTREDVAKWARTRIDRAIAEEAER